MSCLLCGIICACRPEIVESLEIYHGRDVIEKAFGNIIEKAFGNIKERLNLHRAFVSSTVAGFSLT